VYLLKEEQITRTSIYLEKHLHSKAKEAGLNLSKEVSNYLETVLFGDIVGDAQTQLREIEKKIKKNEVELTTLKTRRTDILKLINEHDAKVTAERSIYTKFCNHLNNILSNTDKGYGVEYNQLQTHWKRDFFSNNGSICSKTIKIVLNKADNKKFTFDDFQTLRRGAAFGD